MENSPSHWRSLVLYQLIKYGILSSLFLLDVTEKIGVLI